METETAIETVFHVIPPEGSEKYTLMLEFCEAHRDVLTGYLPYGARLLVQAGLGFDELFKYVRIKGGQFVFIDTTRGWFSKHFSPEQKDQLIEICLGELHIPSANTLMASLRNIALDNAIREEGANLTCLSRKFGLTARYIRMRKAKLGLSNPVVA